MISILLPLKKVFYGPQKERGRVHIEWTKQINSGDVVQNVNVITSSLKKTDILSRVTLSLFN